MKFQFNIDLTDKDYTDFNVFWQTKSRYGKKMLLTLRIFLLLLCFVPTLSAVLDMGFSAESVIPGILWIIIIQLLVANSVQAYLLPAICFGSDIKYNLFKDFIKTKCAAVDTYK